METIDREIDFVCNRSGEYGIAESTESLYKGSEYCKSELNGLYRDHPPAQYLPSPASELNLNFITLCL